MKVRAEDFRLVHPVADAVMVFVTRKDLGVNSVDELIALARKSTDKPLTYGSVGIGSLYHLILENVQASTGIKLAHVPYKGSAPALIDLLAGNVSLFFDSIPSALPPLWPTQIFSFASRQTSENVLLMLLLASAARPNSY